MNRECTTHHHACDCREARFKELEQQLTELREGIKTHRESFLGDAGNIVPEDDALWALLEGESDE